jgi:hypothetical protein
VPLAQSSAQPAQSISDLGSVWDLVWPLALCSDPYQGWKASWEDWLDFGETERWKAGLLDG